MGVSFAFRGIIGYHALPTALNGQQSDFSPELLEPEK
jgi:hypothetical protein